MLRAADTPALYRGLRRLVREHYAMKHGPGGLARNAALVTLASMLVLLGGFLLRRPAALQAPMWGQFLLQGFPVVFLVNFTAAWFYDRRLDELITASPPSNLMLLLGDLIGRLTLFTALTALSFVAWALFHGAFGGSPQIAMASVATTLRYGIRFESLTGVYLYATALGAFPFFLLFFIPILGESPTLRSALSRLDRFSPLRLLPLGVATLCFFVIAGAVITGTFLVLGVAGGHG